MPPILKLLSTEEALQSPFLIGAFASTGIHKAPPIVKLLGTDPFVKFPVS